MQVIEATNSTTKRLVIERLKLHNFKSYWGETTVGPFHPRFSCIVGPNGSGKSNIVDAMMFVFGRKAQQLRMKKLNDLIHKSAAHPDCAFCKVEVIFCEVEYPSDAEGSLPISAYKPIEGSYFTVGREAKADGTSRYTHNDGVIKRDDMVKLLMTYGIDLEHNRFLILQGEVEQVSLLKPMARRNDKGEIIEGGLLEFLEDVIGSTKYVESIDATKAEVDAASMALQAQSDSLKISQVKLSDMKNDVRGNMDYCRFKSAQHKWNSIDGKMKLIKCEDKKSDISDKLALVKKEWKEWKTQVAASKEHLTEKENLLVEKHRMVKKLKKAVENLEDKYEKIENADTEIDMKIKQKKNEIEKYKSDREAQQTKASRFTEKLSKIEIDIPKIQAQDDEYANKLETLQKSFEVMNATIEQDLKSLRDEKIAVDKQVRPALDKFMEINAEIEGLDKSIKKTTELLNKGSTDHASNVQKVTDLRKEIGVCRDQVSEIADQRKNVEKQFNDASRDIEKQRQKLEVMENERNAKNKEYQQLEERHHRMNRASMQDRTVNVLNGHRKSGRLEGFIGSLWDVVTIPDKYAYALASHTNQDVWLTETTETAEAVVDIAKKENLGRVTCMVLPDVRKRYSEKMGRALRNKLPPGAKYMIECVEDVPDHLREALFSRLHDTVIAESLEDAKKFAFQMKYNVVTLAGEKVQKNGVMSGGHVRLRVRSEQVEPVDPRQREALIRELHLLNNNVGKANQEIDGGSLKVKRLQEKLSELAKSSEDLRAGMEHHEKELSLRQKRLDKGEKAHDDKDDAQLKSRLDAQNRELHKLKTLLPALEKNRNLAEDRLEEIDTRIHGCGGPEMVELRANLKSAKQLFDSNRRELSSKKAENNKLTTTLADIKESCLPHIDEQITQASANISIFAEAQQKNTDAALEIEEKISQIKEHEKGVQADLNAVTLELQKLNGENEQHQETENRFRENLDKYTINLKQMEENAARFKKDLDKEIRQWKDLPNFGDINEFVVDDNEEEEDKGEPMKAIEDGSTRDISELFNASVDRISLQDIDSILKMSISDVETVSGEYVEIEIQKAKTQLEKFQNIDLTLFDEFRRIVTDFRRKKAEYDDVEQSYLRVKGILTALETKRYRTFCEGFHVIATHLKELYQMITFGGDADLEFKNAENPFKEGIVFSVRPPKKSWKAIANLSGGEKTLSSLSLIFALHHFKASPLYFLDEIDAALDYRNVAIIAHTLAMRTSNAQFMIISLRNQMFEKADRLIGTFKVNDSTGIIPIDPKQLVYEKTDDENVEPQYN